MEEVVLDMEDSGDPKGPSGEGESPEPLPGVRVWIALWWAGAVLVIVFLAVSVFFSSTGGCADCGPMHDHLMSIPIIAGTILISVCSVFLAVWRILLFRSGPRLGRKNARTVTFAAVSVFVSVFLLNPLVSPVAFLHDSDLDGVQDYSDDYPNNSSRIDAPWAAWTMVDFSMSSSETDWRVTVGDGAFSCWLDATAIELLNNDSESVLQRTPLANLNVEGIQFNNVDKTDRMGEGDSFVIDKASFTDASRFIVWGVREGHWNVILLTSLPYS